ncbi:MAG: YihY/virulence factor BrkB family protein, partial [Rhodothermales bacterium]
MPQWKTYWNGVRDGFVYYVGGVYRYTFQKDIFLWAQAIAFKVLITIVPITILATGILGRILRSEDAFQNVERFIREYIPSFQRSRVLIDFIERLQAAGNFFTGLGIFALVFAAVTLFTTLRVVIGNVFQEEWHRHRSVIGGYIFDLRMAAQVGVLFLLTIGVSFAAQAIQQGGLEVAQNFGLDYVWLQEGWRTIFRLLTYLIPYLLSTAMFFQLFFFIPQPRPPKLSAFIGALVTGLLWEAAKLGFTFYATSVAGFDRYSLTGVEGEAAPSVLGEAFGLIIAFVFWVYYSGLVLIIGALIAVLNEKRVRMRRLKRERARVEETVEEEPAAEVAGNGTVAIGITAFMLMLAPHLASAQVPLSFINSETKVDKISFKFVDHRTFEDNLLEEQIWHDEAGFWDKVLSILPFISRPEYPFDPIELQKDVVRLRRFFQRNGYLH